MSRIVVVGAGMAGLIAAIRLRQAGESVTLITKGIGGIQLGQGSIDVLGYAPELVVDDPLAAVDAFTQTYPYHPYSMLGSEAISNSIGYLQTLVGDLLIGDLKRNYLLPTAVGALRPTALAQPSMVEGECRAGKRIVFVGLRQLKDFWPELIAGNLSRTDLPDGGRVSARAAWIDLPARTNEVDSSPLSYARAMDDRDYRRFFADAVRKVIEPGETVGLPGVLGLTDTEVWSDVADQIAAPVFEVSTIPPSVPGMRLNDLLTQIAKDLRIRFILGSPVVGVVSEGSRITAVRAETAGRPTEYPCDHVVFTPGGFESGALTVDSYIRVGEAALDLPVWVPEGELVTADAFAAQPLFSAGLVTDESMRVLGIEGDPVYDNLYAAGGVLSGAFRWREKSGEGIAIASAVRAADSILGGTQ